MELRTYLQIIDRRKKVIFIVFLVLMTIVILAGLIFPKKYEATTSIRVIPPKLAEQIMWTLTSITLLA